MVYGNTARHDLSPGREMGNPQPKPKNIHCLWQGYTDYVAVGSIYCCLRYNRVSLEREGNVHSPLIISSGLRAAAAPLSFVLVRKFQSTMFG